MEGVTGQPIGSMELFGKRAVQAGNFFRMVLRPMNGYDISYSTDTLLLFQEEQDTPRVVLSTAQRFTRK